MSLFISELNLAASISSFAPTTFSIYLSGLTYIIHILSVGLGFRWRPLLFHADAVTDLFHLLREIAKTYSLVRNDKLDGKDHALSTNANSKIIFDAKTRMKSDWTRLKTS